MKKIIDFKSMIIYIFSNNNLFKFKGYLQTIVIFTNGNIDLYLLYNDPMYHE